MPELFSNLAITNMQGLWFLIPSIPICLWVIYTDLAEMRIRNYAVLALLAVFVVVGFFVMPLSDYLWRFAHFAVVLAIGWVLATYVGVGAGDCKFAAAMAPFVALPDWRVALILYAILSVGGLILHKIARRIPPIQRATTGWVSFDPETGTFPLGISLAVMHLLYLYMGAVQ